MVILRRLEFEFDDDEDEVEVGSELEVAIE